MDHSLENSQRTFHGNLKNKCNKNSTKDYNEDSKENSRAREGGSKRERMRERPQRE